MALALLPAGGGGVRSLLALLPCVGPAGTATTAFGAVDSTGVGTAAVSTAGLARPSATAGASAPNGLDASDEPAVVVVVVAVVVTAASSTCCLPDWIVA